MGRPYRRGEAARGRLLATTAELLHRQGYASTGLNQILEESGAPKGSLYFYFPGGKEELAVAALTRSSATLTQALEQILTAAPTAEAAVAAVIAFFAGQLATSRFEKGCPVATVALEQATSSEALQAVCSAAYRSWERLVEQRLLREGHAPERAAGLANLALTAIEGALLMCRAHRSTEPLERTGRELARILARADRP
jgi:TetR/AcrR family transcriptional repressor of lmrAB and yxaGH operons